MEPPQSVRYDTTLAIPVCADRISACPYSFIGLILLPIVGNAGE